MSGDSELVTIPEADLGRLLAVATMYLDAFREEEAMSAAERMRLTEVERIVERHGRRY